ncbi:MAG: hypothetical protein ACRCZF_06390 [Gemmataceae bacterium]
MAKGKRTLNRRDLRAQSDAAEARDKDDVEEKEDDAEEDEEEASAEEESAESTEEDGGDDDDEAPKKKKKKPVVKKVAVKKPATKRTRAPKEVRMKAVWIVFDNASKRVQTFPFNQKQEAEELLASKIEEKKGTFYLSLVKEAME